MSDSIDYRKLYEAYKAENERLTAENTLLRVRAINLVRSVDEMGKRVKELNSLVQESLGPK